ncbi:MAG: transketolase C-terminal domain-containing protein [Elusimicrobiaceae bacterium]|nr:transketolase C-terminal domain-containing protein [Elusimicrobiaceae bacterium]
MPWTKVLIDDEDLKTALRKDGLRVTTYVNALNEAHRQLLDADPAVYVIGEGVDDPGGVFGSTRGLLAAYGPDRIMDIPIAENGLTGIALGSALCGMKPIFVHMRQDFLPMCMDQIVNHAAKWHYMTGGKCSAPLVIRALAGRGWGSAAQHSQTLHGIFTAFAGLKVAVPATPYDAKGLLIAAVRDGNPVLFCEHRWLYGFEGYAPDGMYEVPFGKAVVRKPGTQVTIVAVSLMVYEAMKAARELERLGVSAEVVDPRTIKPLDRAAIAESVRKTGRLLVADTGGVHSGISAEITAGACEDAFSFMKAPPARIGLPDCPTPAGAELEKAFYPGAADIVACALRLVR